MRLRKASSEDTRLDRRPAVIPQVPRHDGVGVARNRGGNLHGVLAGNELVNDLFEFSRAERQLVNDLFEFLRASKLLVNDLIEFFQAGILLVKRLFEFLFGPPTSRVAFRQPQKARRAAAASSRAIAPVSPAASMNFRRARKIGGPFYVY